MVGFGGFKGIFGGSGGLLGGLIYPDGAIFAPLEVFYMTKIGSKFHKMVQLAKLHWVRITDPIWDIWTPLGAFKRPFFEQIKPFWDANSPESGLSAAEKIMRN